MEQSLHRTTAYELLLQILVEHVVQIFKEHGYISNYMQIIKYFFSQGGILLFDFNFLLKL